MSQFIEHLLSLKMLVIKICLDKIFCRFLNLLRTESRGEMLILFFIKMHSDDF